MVKQKFLRKKTCINDERGILLYECLFNAYQQLSVYQLLVISK